MADEMKVKRSLNVEVGEEAFLCDSITVSHTPAMFVFDMRQNMPVFVPEHQNMTIKQLHKTVVMTPDMAKEFRRILEVQLEKYEQEVRQIKTKEPKKDAPQKVKKEDHYYG
jgi:hypothetical protein